jgi:hypothetical protein
MFVGRRIVSRRLSASRPKRPEKLMLLGGAVEYAEVDARHGFPAPKRHGANSASDTSS